MGGSAARRWRGCAFTSVQRAAPTRPRGYGPGRKTTKPSLVHHGLCLCPRRRAGQRRCTDPVLHHQGKADVTITRRTTKNRSAAMTHAQRRPRAACLRGVVPRRGAARARRTCARAHMRPRARPSRERASRRARARDRALVTRPRPRARAAHGEPPPGRFRAPAGALARGAILAAPCQLSHPLPPLLAPAPRLSTLTPSYAVGPGADAQGRRDHGRLER